MMRATLQRSFHAALQRTIRSTVQRQWQWAFSFGRPSWPLNVMILPMACVQRQSWLPDLDSTTIDSRMGEPGGVVRKNQIGISCGPALPAILVRPKQ
jgi:hypothetical protein